MKGKKPGAKKVDIPESPRERIINAAVMVFAEKGIHGARMEEIGTRAKVNKAMVYYYYSNKKNLFREVLIVIARKIVGGISETLNQETDPSADPKEKIRAVVSAHFDAFVLNPNFARIIINAIADDPGAMGAALKTAQEESGAPLMNRLFSIFNEGIEKGTFRKIDPRQTLISVIGMDLVYFVGAPIARSILSLNIMDEKAFQAERKKNILDLLLYGIIEGKTSAQG